MLKSLLVSSDGLYMMTNLTAPLPSDSMRFRLHSFEYSNCSSSFLSRIQSSPAIARSSSPRLSWVPNSCGLPSQPIKKVCRGKVVGPPWSYPLVGKPAILSRFTKLPPRLGSASEPAGMPIMRFSFCILLKLLNVLLPNDIDFVIKIL